MIALWLIIALLALLLFVKALYVGTLILALPRTGGALFCFTHPAKIAAVLEALPLKAGQVVYDLGCGDGRFLAAAVRRSPVEGVGFEVNLLAWALARLKRLFSGRRFRVERRDFWRVGLGDADLVFCYRFPDLMERLAAKAERELKEGAVLVSCNFPLPGWRPMRILTAAEPAPQDPIYLYRKGS